MKKYTLIGLLCVAAMTLYAVPAYRGWQTKTQPDGTTLRVRLNGDEYYHYYTNEQNEVVAENVEGYWQVVENAISTDTINARRAKSPIYRSNRARKDVGTINLAPRGLVLLVNFSDSKYQSTNTQADMDSMMNASSYTYGGSYGSARQYFSDQSFGAYQPIFDVVGPITLSKACSYYGTDGSEEGDDQHAADMIVEACKLADTQFDVDFTKYDNDNDGYVDFVYVIYAGKGQADGGATTTIWPHNWNIYSAVAYNYCTYTWANCKVDGLYINNYACSGELNGSTGNRNGIGTLCHEFGHVLGLPDYYDTNYGTNYNNGLTPNDWDIMDYGSYNNDGLCPPNYSAWERYYFGWVTPVNPAKEAGSFELTASSNSDALILQLNSSATLQSATTSGVNYYLENRQQTGWDKYLPGHGLLIWKVNYSSSKWESNEPNNTSNNPYYTIVSATGSTKNIGKASDPFPGTSKVTKWSTLSAQPILDITESDGLIYLTYIENEVNPTVTWIVDGDTIETKQYTSGETLVLPTAAVVPCTGTQFIGWTTQKDWRDPFVEPDDLFTVATGTVKSSKTYYALFQ